VPPCDERPSPLELPLPLEPLIPPELLLPLDPLMPSALLLPVERSDPRSIDGFRVAELPMPSSFRLPRSVRLPRSRDESLRFDDDEDPLMLSPCEVLDEPLMPSDLRSVISAYPHC